jgi:hypothetical protein
MHRASWPLVLAAAALAAAALIPACDAAGPPAVLDVSRRTTALALLDEGIADAAAQALQAIIADDGRFAFDRINLAIAHAKLGETKAALDSLAEAEKLAGGYPQAAYLRGLCLKRLRQYPEALAALEEALRRDPGCREAHFQIGLVHEWEKRHDQATASFRKVLESGELAARRSAPFHGWAMYLAHMHLSQIAMEQDREDESDRQMAEAQKYKGESPPQAQVMDIGPCASPVRPTDERARAELARAGVTLQPDCPTARFTQVPRPWPGKGPGGSAGPAAVAGLAWTTAGLSAIWTGGPDGTTLVRKDGAWAPGAALGPGTLLASADLDGDAREEAVVATPGAGGAAAEVRAFPPRGAGAPAPPLVLAGVTAVTAALAVDQDHDGDLDLVLAGRGPEGPAGGLRPPSGAAPAARGGRNGLWTFLNKSAPPRPSGAPGPASPPFAFEPVSHEQVGLTTATDTPVAGLAAGDLDEANDIDVVAFPTGSPPFALLSRRQGRFVRVPLAGPPGTGRGALSDVTGDALLDVVYPTASGIALVAGRGDGTFIEPAMVRSGTAFSDVQAADLDGDMFRDLVALDSRGTTVVLMNDRAGGYTPLARERSERQSGPARERSERPSGPDLQSPRPARERSERSPMPVAEAAPTAGPASPGAPGGGAGAAAGRPLVEDVDGDGVLDLALPGRGLLAGRPELPGGGKPCFLRLTLAGTGQKVNSRGVGCRVWVRAGGRVVRREIEHAGELFGLGGCSQADLVSVQWTNGVRQNHLGPAPTSGGARSSVVACGQELVVPQRAGLEGSCPYLYADRGRGPEYVTDLLAGSPLGLPGPDGRPVPGSPTELVLLPRSAWAPVSGSYRLRVTEEYREVTFLDQVRLWVVDHPPGWTVLPDSGIGTEPGEPRLLAFDRVEPVRAARRLGGASRDAGAELAAADGVHLEPPRTAMQGLAPLHALELTLPEIDPGRRVWLVLAGFVYWTDAGLNTRLAQADPARLVAPRLLVPDPGAPGAAPKAPPRPSGAPEGRGWRTALPFVRFPAGRSKTAVVDVTGLVDPADRRVRIETSMRLYLDRVAVASTAVTAAVRGPPPWLGSPPIAIRRLAPSAAVLVFHGLVPLSPDPDRPPWTLDARARHGALEAAWLIPRGDYTRFGPVGPLVVAFDDRYVVMGPGDGVDLSFPVPPGPAPGLVRDLLLEVSGYDKDAHPATFASSTVEPYPYRGMPVYAAGSRFPAGTQRRLAAAHRAWSTRHRDGWGGALPEGAAAPSAPRRAVRAR